ncbi:hypothetical protein DV515_00011887 [Chloebia gouldiae]|uniref:Aspartic peptidase DDI1-type domain-containing protein n=1 Tax=Chloebia gouldiae TaxID=44316 RepID=A0A3L8S669_CHLGU|nr:hypothetical protein DV515_00011887 [Chloebia gouldiae]
MFYSGILTEPSRKEAEIREVASLRQQRRMKQAVQFIHKDSADLLPLDGLKKLGTSKDTQPHNILQKRLMETNLSKFRGSRGSWAPKGDLSSQTNKLNQIKLGSSGKTEDEELIVVSCQCAGKELKAVVDTSSQHNLMSSACLDRLGLKEHLKALPAEEEMVSLPNKVKAIGQIEDLSLTVGAVPVECAALVVEDNDQPFSFGLQTLKSLKCVINMEKHHLVLGQMDREEIPFVGIDSAEAGEQIDARGSWLLPQEDAVGLPREEPRLAQGEAVSAEGGELLMLFQPLVSPPVPPGHWQGQNRLTDQHLSPLFLRDQEKQPPPFSGAAAEIKDHEARIAAIPELSQWGFGPK